MTNLLVSTAIGSLFGTCVGLLIWYKHTYFKKIAEIESNVDQRVEDLADKKFADYRDDYQNYLENELRRKDIQWPCDEPIDYFSHNYPVSQDDIEQQFDLIRELLGSGDLSDEQINFSQIFMYRIADINLGTGQPNSGSSQIILKIDVGGNEIYRNVVKKHARQRGD